MPTVVNRLDVQRLQQQGATIAEVLPHEEYELEHIAGAIHLPLKELDASTVEQLPRDRPIVVYCNDFL